ncbi:PBP1A family penicillin-binding protein [Thermoflexus sp.]|uniref:penicillin-binding protein n=1 Tax=Thermoflexus sp. TaxID=1969742 RepID=UPI002ADDA833|nr:PBP1A family penicillin-binding protein [Thermoflexus sp.]
MTLRNSELGWLLERRRMRRARSRQGTRAWIRLALVAVIFLTTAFGVLTAAGVAGAAALYTSLVRDLDPSRIEASARAFETTKIYDRTGRILLYEVIDPTWGDRTWVPLDQIPLSLRQATIAIEDRSFYENPGINPRGLLRALWINLRTGGEIVQGGSSITQQLVKNTLIDPQERYQRSYARKIKEILLALEISRRYSKNQILELYLNTNFYGNLAYGVEAAARIYFGKHVWELNLAESAMLAAIPQFPSLNPIDAPREAKRRQELVLDAMVKEGYITPEEAAAAKAQPLQIRRKPTERFDIRAPHFSIYVRRWLEERFGPDLVNRGGLRVYTTLDWDLQQYAEEAVRRHVEKLKSENRNVTNGALVAIRPKTGEILAMVGSVDYWDESIDGRFNVAVDGLRQPGSSFKPFTYATLLSQGVPASHLFWDVPKTFDQGPGMPPYAPENYDRKFHGPQRMRLALARSYNIPAVEALQMAGIANVIRLAHRMGITTLDKGLDYYGLALTLGGGEVRLIDMVYAFSVFANHGFMAGAPVPEERRRPGYRELDPVPVLRVETPDGKVLWEYRQPEVQAILDPRVAYLITSILSDNAARWEAFGRGNALELSRPAAVKTGTTNDFRDNWTIGYTPQLAVGVWVGNTDNSPMRNVSGIAGAAPIWHDVMEYAHRNLPVEPFQRPPGLIEKTICAVSGKLPGPYCPTVRELFIPGTEPQEVCDLHQAFLINRETGKLATASTPPDQIEEKVFLVVPPEALGWARETGIPQPPTEYDTQFAQPVGDVAILNPAPYAYVRGIVPIIGNARGDVAFYRVAVGAGLNPTAWIPIGPDHGNPVDNGLLENWDTAGFADGLYTLQLTVVRRDGSVHTAVAPVTVDHTPPSVRVVYPREGERYSPADEWISVNTEVSDNYAMDRVEFYADGQPFAVRDVPPFNAKWYFRQVERDRLLGCHEFWVKAYDKAGNETESNRVRACVGR